MKRLFLVVFMLAGTLLAACGSSGPSTAASSSPQAVASGSPSIAAPSAGSASTASQTETVWGRIWDTLPTGFPTIPSATPEDAASGPASASLVVQGNAAKSIATNMQTALEAAGFRTQGLSGPLEDGSYVLDSVGTTTGCLVQVTAAPIGGVTTVMIMYGARCPHG